MPRLQLLKSRHLDSALLLVCIAVGFRGATASAQSSSNNNNFAASKFLGWGTSSGDLLIKTNDVTRVTVQNSTGNVGIGTTTPANSLEVVSNTAKAAVLWNTTTSTAVKAMGLQSLCSAVAGWGTGIDTVGGYIGLKTAASGTGSTGSPDRYGVMADASGGAQSNVGVRGSGMGGTNSFGVYAYAWGGTNAYGIYASGAAATTNWGGYFSGNVYTNGVYNPSDRKLKTDIRPLSDSLSIIRELRPSVYTYRTDVYKQMNLPEGERYGLIADEVRTILPSVVRRTVQPAEYENGDAQSGKKLSDEVEFSSINYTEMVPILIAGMKEQQAMIERLSDRVASLEASLRAGTGGPPVESGPAASRE